MVGFLLLLLLFIIRRNASVTFLPCVTGSQSDPSSFVVTKWAGWISQEQFDLESPHFIPTSLLRDDATGYFHPKNRGKCRLWCELLGNGFRSQTFHRVIGDNMVSKYECENKLWFEILTMKIVQMHKFSYIWQFTRYASGVLTASGISNGNSWASCQLSSLS